MLVVGCRVFWSKARKVPFGEFSPVRISGAWGKGGGNTLLGVDTSPVIGRPCAGNQNEYAGSMNNAVETYRYITRTLGVCGGHARVEGSRIAVHDVIGLLQNGETVDSVTRQLPGLTRAQVYECLAYYEDHLAEVDYLIARQMAEAGA